MYNTPRDFCGRHYILQHEIMFSANTSPLSKIKQDQLSSYNNPTDVTPEVDGKLLYP